MPELPIRIWGDPVLKKRASAVDRLTSQDKKLIEDMIETMLAADGAGLAAPQVGVPLRLFTYGWVDDDDVEHRGVAINPVLLISPPPVAESDEDSDAEGCLSFPGERFPLVRSTDALLRAVDLDQKPFEIAASGWLARIFQHEFDHLGGILYVDRLEFIYGRRASKIARKRGWTEPGSSWMPGVDDLDA